ncbi:flagellar FliL protein [Crenobacter luteus]|uniref:Flagellar basal body-associated protein FliL n=1 Tax=Crenobacter luteus TaxID=1452487 RepID=A0A165F6W1_9NEIS|nr:flagellar basal body-associated protein FliL [Crenobacter luteus]KZE31744.1 flagellar basal body-associated protein FliL [Crenobacter luteus]TCP15608.1 flagellar FliL protein [Crenobacter luteus]
MSKKSIVVVALGMVVALAAGAGGVYWWANSERPPAEPGQRVAAADAPSRFVGLDKVVVMLKGEAGAGELHYMAVDLVFRTTEQDEKSLKAQLPYLKTVAVRALSQLELARASAMGIDDYQALLAKAYTAAYAAEAGGRPFSEVMVGKLIIE